MRQGEWNREEITRQAPNALPRNMKLRPERLEEQGLPNPTAFDILNEVKKNPDQVCVEVTLQARGNHNEVVWLAQVACKKKIFR